MADAALIPGMILADSTVLRRVVVVGTSCAGKTTFARQLAGRLGAPCIELDALHWLPEWHERPPDEFRELTRDAVAAERWVVDGNYTVVRDIVWPRATALVWLDYSFPVVFSRALRRTFVRSWRHDELFAGNRESFRKSFLSRDSILLWVIRTHRRRRRQYRNLVSGAEFPHLASFDLRRPRDADELLRGVARVCPNDGPDFRA